MSAIVWLFLAGTGFLLGLTDLTTTLQESIDDHDRPRVMGLWTVAFLGARLPAATLNGAVADLFGLSVAMALVALISVLSGGGIVLWLHGGGGLHTAQA